MPQWYTAYTLVDITESGVTNSKTEDVAGYNQQQNLNTLIQLISLRSQPVQYSMTTLKAQDLVNYKFGTVFQGLHTVWQFKFASEHTDVFRKDEDSTYFLTHDCDGVAFTANLSESVNFTTPIFNTTDSKNKNIYFIDSV